MNKRSNSTYCSRCGNNYRVSKLKDAEKQLTEIKNNNVGGDLV